MSGLELIGFIIALEPLIARGRDLVDRYKTYKTNRKTLKLHSSLTTFNNDLSTTLSDLQTRSQHLPLSTRDIISADAQLLIKHLQKALQHSTLIDNYSANRVTQFLRAKSLADQFDNLFLVLEKAETIVQQARKFMEIMNTLHHVSGMESGTDQFRPSFPALRDTASVMLQFDKLRDDGNPAAVEGCIKKKVTTQASGRRVVAIHGAAGVGKSTILTGLIRDELVTEVFPDGIHVIKLGMDATTGTLFQALCRVLTDSGAVKTEASLHSNNNIDDALDAAIAWFRGRRCSFFVDDVWCGKIGIGPISRLCELADERGEKVVVITSREHEVAALAPRENVIRIKPREPLGLDSRRILFLHASVEETELADKIDESVTRVLTICGGLPISLAAAGKGVKMMRVSMDCPEAIAWQRYASNLQECREQLLTQNVGAYGNLVATFAASVAVLDEQKQSMVDLGTTLTFAEMHRRLCVLQKQASVPVSMLRHLWEVESDIQTELIAMRFAQIGLASSEGEQVDSMWVWRMSLHDSLHDFSVMNARRCNDVKTAHEALLRGYGLSLPGLSAENGASSWWAQQLLPDGYIHENVCRHLYHSGRVTELVRVLLSPEWTARRLEVNDVFSLEGDFLLGIKAAQEQSFPENREIGKGLQLILAALRLSSGFITRNPREVWFQLLGRLNVHADNNNAVAEYLAKAGRLAQRPWLQCLNTFLITSGGATTRIFTVDSIPQCMTVLQGKCIACGCNDGTILVLDLSQGRVQKEWRAHDTAVTAVVTWKDLLLTASQDSTARLWNIATGACVTTFEGHSGWVTSVAVTVNERVISGSTDGTTRVWSMDGELVMGPYTNAGPVWCVASLLDGRVVSAGIDKIVRIWDESGEAACLDGHEDWVTCLAVSSDGNIISGSNDGTVRIWNSTNLKQIGALRHTDYVQTVGISNGWIVSGGRDCTICVWDETEMIRKLSGHRDWVNGVCFVNDSVVSCALDGTVRVWDIRNAGTVIPDAHARVVHSIAFAPDGRAITGSADRTIRIWHPSGVVQGTLHGHDNAVTGVTVCSDGSVASVSRDRTLRIWDGESFEMINVLRGHEGWVTCVESLDAGPVVTGSTDRTMRIWNLEDDECIVVPTNEIIALIFAHGNTIICVTLPGTITIYIYHGGHVTKLREVEFEHAWKLGRAEIMDLVGERVRGDGVLMVRGSREMRFGGSVLASLESPVRAWDSWHDIVALGLEDGRVAFLKLVHDGDG